MKETNIYGYRVFYEDNCQDGVHYLANDLQKEEAMVFFEHAKNKGVAHFETDKEEQYSLIWRNGGSYLLIRRT